MNQMHKNAKKIMQINPEIVQTWPNHLTYLLKNPSLCNPRMLVLFIEELSKLIWEKPSTQIAKDYKISDKTVEKWCKSYNLQKPPRGYWMKQKFKTH